VDNPRPTHLTNLLDTHELVTHPAVLEDAQKVVDAANKLLSRPKQVKRVRLLSDLWSVDSGEPTPTLQRRRRAVRARYSAVGEALYGQPSSEVASA
jgi:long-chain acyl-CoA synthetase